MRYIAPLLISGFFLSACHSLDNDIQVRSTAPIAITQISSQGNANKGLVEIKITVSNRLPQELKNIRIVLLLRDAQGNRLSTEDQDIEILGPIHEGQSFGPLSKVIRVANNGTVCVEVNHIEAMTLDYSMLKVDGKEANAMVKNGQNCLQQP